MTRSLRLLAVFPLALVACSDFPTENGVTCGGSQYASARLTLPDTGINASATIAFGFRQHDPYLQPEGTELAFQQLPAPGIALILPYLRLVHDDGRILLEQGSTAGSFGQTWVMLHVSRSAEVRKAIFEALQSGSLSLQLMRWPDELPGTTVRIVPSALGVRPVARCG